LAAPAAALQEALGCLRGKHPDLDAALRGLDSIDADYNDHCGFMVPTVDQMPSTTNVFACSVVGSYS
jgi:hypothetical protein